MRVAIEMQQLSFDMKTGVIASWLVDIGAHVTAGDPIAEIEIEKTTVEMPALDSGRLVEIVHGQDAEVEVGVAIAYLETNP
jgi:pyruvate/2-oxoglutarate dehydrogenase complex dihydrolipoamide acyltransferase (E2) component